MTINLYRVELQQTENVREFMLAESPAEIWLMTKAFNRSKQWATWKILHQYEINIPKKIVWWVPAVEQFCRETGLTYMVIGKYMELRYVSMCIAQYEYENRISKIAIDWTFARQCGRCTPKEEIYNLIVDDENSSKD